MQANNMWQWLIPINNDAIFFRNNLLLISKTHLNFCSFIQRIIWQINWSNLNSSLEIRNVLNIYIYNSIYLIYRRFSEFSEDTFKCVIDLYIVHCISILKFAAIRVIKVIPTLGALSSK